MCVLCLSVYCFARCTSKIRKKNCSLSGLKTKHWRKASKWLVAGFTWAELTSAIYLSRFCVFSVLKLFFFFVLTICQQKYPANKLHSNLDNGDNNSGNLIVHIPCARHCVTHRTPFISQQSCLVGMIITVVLRGWNGEDDQCGVQQLGRAEPRLSCVSYLHAVTTVQLDLGWALFHICFQRPEHFNQRSIHF